MEHLSKHIPVLVEEVVAALQPISGKTYLDATFGGGGHTKAILEASAPNGRVVAIDRDQNVKIFADQVSKQYGDRFEFYVLNYADCAQLGRQFDGAVLDLGMSTDQLASSGRGFSFQRIEPLDLRFGNTGQTAAQFLQQSSFSEIERVFREYAQDRYAKRLAARIVEQRRARPIRTTTDFVECVGTNNPKVLAPLFQALRIKVNDELANLRRGLEVISSLLVPKSVLAVISFHSLEDKIVKDFFRDNGYQFLTKKPVKPTQEEIINNPSSRSAKLRAGRKG
jgi:16S rRNA (cytosine1402-N4)-methyltransferase